MQTKHSSTPLLIVVLLVLTFPLWFGVIGGMFGLITGLISGTFGLITGLVDVFVSIALLPVRLIFGWNEWDWGFPLFHHHGFRLTAIAIVLVLLLYKRKKATN